MRWKVWMDEECDREETTERKGEVETEWAG